MGSPVIAHAPHPQFPTLYSEGKRFTACGHWFRAAAVLPQLRLFEAKPSDVPQPCIACWRRTA